MGDDESTAYKRIDERLARHEVALEALLAEIKTTRRYVRSRNVAPLDPPIDTAPRPGYPLTN